MTGPEHYLNAESDLEHAARASDKGREDDVRYWLECAQVHAALATAAAFVDHMAVMRPEDRDEWDHATGRSGEVTP